MSKVVKDLLKTKNKKVHTIEPGSTVFNAIAQMAAKQIGSLVVIEGDKVVGIITERDYARKVILQNKSSKNTLVREIMTKRVIYVQPEHKMEECMAIMTDKRIRHLPVLEENRLIGMISIGDVVKELISEKELLIDQLTKYISGY